MKEITVQICLERRLRRRPVEIVLTLFNLVLLYSKFVFNKVRILGPVVRVLHQP